MSHKKTFDPDDTIKTVTAELITPKTSFLAIALRTKVEAYLKPNESSSRGRGIHICVGVANSSPENVALAFEEFARQIRESTRKTPRLNRLGTSIKKAMLIGDKRQRRRIRRKMKKENAT